MFLHHFLHHFAAIHWFHIILQQLIGFILIYSFSLVLYYFVAIHRIYIILQQFIGFIPFCIEPVNNNIDNNINNNNGHRFYNIIILSIGLGILLGAITRNYCFFNNKF